MTTPARASIFCALLTIWLALPLAAQDWNRSVVIDHRTIVLDHDVIIHQGSSLTNSCFRLNGHRMVFETGARGSWVTDNQFTLNCVNGKLPEMQLADDLGHGWREIFGPTATIGRYKPCYADTYRADIFRKWLNLLAYLNLHWNTQGI